MLNAKSEKHIHLLINHIVDQEYKYNLKMILIRHNLLFDTTRTSIAKTPIPHVICTGDNPPSLKVRVRVRVSVIPIIRLTLTLKLVGIKSSLRIIIGLDYSGPFPVTPNGNKYVLAITDYFTK